MSLRLTEEDASWLQMGQHLRGVAQQVPLGGSVPALGESGLPPDLARIVETHQQPSPGTLAGVQDALLALLEAIKAQVPTGRVHEETWALSNTQVVDIYFPRPLFTLKITNDGPGNVQYRSPDVGSAPWVPLFTTETDSLNFVEARCASIGLQLTAGASASVRLRGLV